MKPARSVGTHVVQEELAEAFALESVAPVLDTVAEVDNPVTYVLVHCCPWEKADWGWSETRITEMDGHCDLSLHSINVWEELVATPIQPRIGVCREECTSGQHFNIGPHPKEDGIEGGIAPVTRSSGNLVIRAVFSPPGTQPEHVEKDPSKP
jgi:hypothetical protein